jgi:Ca2+-binding EF-hand superfamily protein
MQVTPHEANLMFRRLKSETVDYKDFREMLYNARFEIAKSRIMDTNIDVLDKHLLDLFKKADKDDNGELHIDEIKHIMLHSKFVQLTPL